MRSRNWKKEISALLLCAIVFGALSSHAFAASRLAEAPEVTPRPSAAETIVSPALVQPFAEEEEISVTFFWNYPREEPVFKEISVPSGELITAPLPLRTGYTFLGWYVDEEGSLRHDFSLPVEGDLTLYARWEPETPVTEYFHQKFMRGRPDGKFLPDTKITRAEVAAILVRTVAESFTPEAQAPDIAGRFTDVEAQDWFYPYVAWAYEYDLIKGFDDNSFRPDTPVERQEFAAMIARTTDVLPAGEIPFSDAAQIEAWARDYVYTVYEAGWMRGHDKAFRPAQGLTRAEAATTLNRVLERGETTAASIADVEEYLHIFPDADNPGQWYFYDVLEATNSHWMHRENGLEIWTKIENGNAEPGDNQ